MPAQNEEVAGIIAFSEDHKRRYLATDGADGGETGAPVLLLTTTGRRTGLERTSPMYYGRDGDRYLVVGSIGGNPRHAQWYLNLLANPDVTVQVGAERFKARAHEAAPEEKPRLWKIMTALWPAYDEYQARTTREIPVVVLERS
jgi:deazaflavin-dependent oxidoreductase (nitroreductase family)